VSCAVNAALHQNRYAAFAAIIPKMTKCKPVILMNDYADAYMGRNKMLEGKGRIFKVGKYTVAVRLPKTLVQDSTFPLKVGDKVNVKIDGDKIVIRM